MYLNMYAVEMQQVIEIKFLFFLSILGLKNKFLKWKEAFESMGLKVNFGKTKVMAAAASQRMACLNVKLTHVAPAA